jgi:hypothetical protein
MGVRDLLFLGVVVGGAGIVGAGLLQPAGSTSTRPVRRAGSTADLESDVRPILAAVNASFRRDWAERGLEPTPPAPELALMRRLALALTGSIPSLEEVRRFESRPPAGRVAAWLNELLRDRRCADYLAERLARAFVGTEDGPFLLFRRRRFTTWLSDAILENRPYDRIVRDLIADQGLWTDHPATNFISVAFDQTTGLPDPERITARVARAFLGVRLDCAQCHDHPFRPWKQADFRGLAAFFGGVHSDLRGIRDGGGPYRPPDRKTKEPTTVEPQVPFHPELRPGSGTRRAQLAAWVVDARNPNLARATVNRIWALLLGRPLSEPVDDLPDSGELHPALSLLSADFAAHGYNLRRLIRIVATSEVFRLESSGGDAILGPSDEQDESWAAFPMSRLRPEQVAGALFQAATLSTLGPMSPWVVRLAAFTGRNDFVRRYGDTGDDEFGARGGTIPQRLLLMNGDLVREKIKDDLFNAATRIAVLSPDDRKAVEAAYLTVLTRRPTAEESAYFEDRLARAAGHERKERLTDLFWTLLNTTEFSWNH